MMFKIILTILTLFLFSSNSYAEIESNISLNKEEKINKIIEFYKNRLKNIDNLQIKFLEENYDFPFEAYVFEFKTNKEKTKEIVFLKGNYFFTDYVDLNTMQISKDKVQDLISKDKYSDIIKELTTNDKELIVSLGKGRNNLYVFSDPQCPFCVKHLKTIDEKFLQENKVNFIFISVHNNFKIIGSLYANLSEAKNDKEKLEIIREFYTNSSKYNDDNKINEEKYKKAFDKYLNMGVAYTPFIIKG
ncbi:thiol peroxidase [Campylobacter peloridis]|uniref:Thiol peroxidase n=2 Tax=Campylobacter peloridis TaxID=488546 RepID=A0A5C7DRJ6_9BACT|nr:thiol peroxidase [Campylobacter peloridis]